MTVGKISVACWVVFVAMSLLFLPGLALAAAIGDATVPALGYVAGAGVIALWWGPFVYAMYLSLAVMRNGDKRLLARGRRGTAEVLEAERTNTVIQAGEFEWQAPFVYKYRLRITLPGKGTYETTCRICLTGIDAGDTVEVAVSPRNRHRVTIDPGSIRHRRATARREHVDAPGRGHDGLLSHVREFRPRARELDGVEVGDAQAVRDPGRPRSRQRRGLLRGGTAPTGSGPSAETSAGDDRLDQLERLGDLRDRGVLTPEEFAAEKARILGEPT